MSARIDFRAPTKHKQMIRDIARNLKKSEAIILREALEQYLSGYTQIPTVKQLNEQVQRHEKDLSDIKKALLKKGVLE